MDITYNAGGVGLWTGVALLPFLLLVIAGVIRRKNTHAVLPTLLGIGSLALIVVALGGRSAEFILPLPCYLGVAHAAFIVDPLSRWFLAIIGIVGVCAALFTPGYLDHLKERIPIGLVWSGFALLFVSMVCVVLAANAVTFLVAWELMALSSFALVAVDHERRSVRRASLIYLGATRAGTAFLMGGFLWAYHLSGSWAFGAWQLHGAIGLAPALLIFVGLAAKAGCWPFHIWLPIAHPAAPAPVSAVMSGVMIKTAIYAMLRIFVVGHHVTTPTLGPIVLALGAISAFWGILFALLQNDLKRLLAYSSVENIGIILMGVGVAIIGRTYNVPLLAKLGLAAALLHSLNHAIFKSLLFFGAGAVDSRTHIRDLDRLGGLMRRMPWTGAAFVAGAAAICALPPFNGFVSEWMLYRGFFEMALHGPTVATRLTGILLMGWLAIVGALALACFVKAVGVVFIGQPRSKQAERATEVGRGMIAAQVLLACLCAALGLCVPVLLAPINHMAAAEQSQALTQVWSIPLPVLFATLVATLGLIAVWFASLARRTPPRAYITWECGFDPLGPRMQYTASSFAQPLSRIFGSVYNFDIEVKRNRKQFADAVVATTSHEPYLETRVYAPLMRGINHLSGVILLRLQAGSIHQYLFNMMLVLLLLLWVVCRQ